MAPQIGAVVIDRTLPFVSLALLGYTWYVYVFRVCISAIYNELGNKAEAVIFIIIACIFWAFALWSYAVVLTTGPGTPEKNYPQPVQPPPLAQANASQLPPSSSPPFAYSPEGFDIPTMRQIPVLSDPPTYPFVSVTQHDGRPRFCQHCQRIKPDRAHHCRECDSCTLKMDHHCPWVSGCVGHGNYKFFYQFVSYTALYALWVFATTLPTVIDAVVKRGFDIDVQWIVTTVLAFLFGFLLFSFSCAHGYYILTNTTTIESISDRPYYLRVDFDRSGYNYQIVVTDIGEKLWNIGYSANWRSVMGDSVAGWFFPIKNVLGNGFTYPFNAEVYDRMVRRARDQSRMSGMHHNDSTLPSVHSPLPKDTTPVPDNHRYSSEADSLV
ncbi:DHHC palmitoyltransferase-domain-containing protein [Umbelopsis sp. PMI_123]|nr:DHHC palmitoyltransferase-domain-containing protein [Umbelopsis sp. PMI_123]